MDPLRLRQLTSASGVGSVPRLNLYQEAGTRKCWLCGSLVFPGFAFDLEQLMAKM